MVPAVGIGLYVLIMLANLSILASIDEWSGEKTERHVIVLWSALWPLFWMIAATVLVVVTLKRMRGTIALCVRLGKKRWELRRGGRDAN